MTKSIVLSPELWKMILEYTAHCSIKVMEYVLTEDSCEMGERSAFDEEVDILRYRPVSRVFADSVLELITSVSIPQDVHDSRSGALFNILLSRPRSIHKIDLYYPLDRIIAPSALDDNVWEQIAKCKNLRELILEQYNHLSESNLAAFSEENSRKLSSLTYCCDISDGILDLLCNYFPNLEKLELQAKSLDQIMHTDLVNVSDMKRFSNLKVLIDSDGELLRSDATIRSLCTLPALHELQIGESDNFIRAGMTSFAFTLLTLSMHAKEKPLEQLKILQLNCSYRTRSNSPYIDDALRNLSRTFVNLQVLTVKYASCLLSSIDNIKGLSLLTQLVTLDLRKSEIAVLKVSTNTNYSVARTSAWCDEYLPYFPPNLVSIYFESEASGNDIFRYSEQVELKACMTKLKDKVSELTNVKFFSCEALPTFGRAECRAWHGVYFNKLN